MNQQNTRETPFVNAPTRKTVQWICKTQCPKAQNAMNILRSQSVKAQESFLHCALALFAVVCPKSQNGTMNRQNSINILRSQSVRSQECFLTAFTLSNTKFFVLGSKIVNALKRKIQWTFFVFKRRSSKAVCLLCVYFAVFVRSSES